MRSIYEVGPRRSAVSPGMMIFILFAALVLEFLLAPSGLWRLGLMLGTVAIWLVGVFFLTDPADWD